MQDDTALLISRLWSRVHPSKIEGGRWLLDGKRGLADIRPGPCVFLEADTNVRVVSLRTGRHEEEFEVRNFLPLFDDFFDLALLSVRAWCGLDKANSDSLDVVVCHQEG
mgnify:CR=1 FL=1